MAQINDKQVGIPGTLYTDTLTNIQAIANPIEGMLAKDSVSHNIYQYSNGAWRVLISGHVIRDVLNSVTMTHRGQLNISGTTLVDEPGTGSAGDTLLNLYNQVVQIASASQTPRQNINFVSGATAADNPGNNSTDITIAAGSQTYILDSQVRSWMGL